MATPNYDALVSKVRDWSNKPEVNTIPDDVIQDCLRYSADEAYRLLRIPPLEEIVTYTIDSSDSIGANNGNLSYTRFSMPEDLTEFIYVRSLDSDTQQTAMFNQITDKRSFFDPYAENFGYSNYRWMWQEGKIHIKPQLEVGTIVEIHYYKRLPSLNAAYSVSPLNYLIPLSDALQPYMVIVATGGTNLYFSTSNGAKLAFSTSEEAAAYDSTVTTVMFEGNEVPHWMRDQNERLLIWGALFNLGGYLFDDTMEKRYQSKFLENVASLNKEEKWRRSLGGNVQTNVITNGLI